MHFCLNLSLIWFLPEFECYWIFAWIWVLLDFYLNLSVIGFLPEFECSTRTFFWETGLSWNHWLQLFTEILKSSLPPFLYLYIGHNSTDNGYSHQPLYILYSDENQPLYWRNQPSIFYLIVLRSASSCKEGGHLRI